MAKQDIENFTLAELKEEISRINEPLFRATQIFFWLYKKGVREFDEMKNIPNVLRKKLQQFYYISSLELNQQFKSKDGTEKFIFKLSDGNFIETVLLYTGQRKTVCISTQVGCRFACLFCASGSNGFIRNLTSSEIINQVLFLQQNLKNKITNYVFMGMGEPLDNYENLKRTILIMNGPWALGIAARRITVSTCGLIPGIERLKNLGLQINLAVSLHAANDRLRNTVMPINKKYPLEKLIKACEDFIETIGRMVTLEYIMIKGRNDSLQDAHDLALIAKRLNSKVNLIACSNVGYRKFLPPAERDIDIFMKRLKRENVKVTLRNSKGSDINAACGQLAGRIRRL